MYPPCQYARVRGHGCIMHDGALRKDLRVPFHSQCRTGHVRHVNVANMPCLATCLALQLCVATSCLVGSDLYRHDASSLWFINICSKYVHVHVCNKYV
eukprot:jgi/Botrbrau1/3342/Bobra.0048s0037.1